MVCLKSLTIEKRTGGIFDNLKGALQHQKKYDGRIYAMNDEEYEEYFRWRELEEDWTIEVDENFFFLKDMWMEVRVWQILIVTSRMAKPTTVKMIHATKR